MRKVEIISNTHDHELNLEVCPLCHSPIHTLPPAKDSAVEFSAVESSFQLPEKAELDEE
jgi:hypothetical protein